MTIDPDAVAAFIRQRLRLTPVAGLEDVRLFTPHASSGLTRFLGDSAEPPYWAWPWAGGLVLAHYLRHQPDLLAGRTILDLGAGSGLVGIVAAKLDAGSVLAAEADPVGRVALGLNAEANDVTIRIIDLDLPATPPEVDIILAGDVFYDAAVGWRMLAFLDRAQAAGIDVLIGDPGRKPLPLARLEPIHRAAVADFGSGGAVVDAAVYRLRPAARSPATP